MKQITLCSLLMLTALSATAEQEYEYKCWVTLTTGEQVVSFHKFTFQGNTIEAKYQVEAQQVVQLPQGLRALSEVHECAALNSSFIQVEAQSLDQVTVR